MKAADGFAACNAFQNGDVAQLGERLPCKQNVAGSIPVISTIVIGESLRAKCLTSSQTIMVYSAFS